MSSDFDYEQSQFTQSCSIIWGLCYFLKQQNILFTEGKLASSELHQANQKCLKKLRKTTNLIRLGNFTQILAKTNSISHVWKQALSARSLLPNPSKERTRSRSKSKSGKHAGGSGGGDLENNSETIAQKLIDQLLYIVQLDSIIVYYSAKNGRMSVQRLGANINQSFFGVPPKHPLFVDICFPGTDESVSLIVPIETTLTQLRDFICDESHWEEQVITIPNPPSADACMSIQTSSFLLFRPSVLYFDPRPSVATGKD